MSRAQSSLPFSFLFFLINCEGTIHWKKEWPLPSCCLRYLVANSACNQNDWNHINQAERVEGSRGLSIFFSRSLSTYFDVNLIAQDGRPEDEESRAPLKVLAEVERLFESAAPLIRIPGKKDLRQCIFKMYYRGYGNQVSFRSCHTLL